MRRMSDATSAGTPRLNPNQFALPGMEHLSHPFAPYLARGLHLRYTPHARLRRGIYRLIALVELFDGEVLRTKRAIMEEPGYRVGQTIAGLENEFFRLTARRSDPELTRIVVTALDSLLPDGGWPSYEPALRRFIDEHSEKLRRIYGDYLEDDRIPLVSQPESLLVFERLENDRFHLIELWHEKLPASLLESMSEIWGVPVDVG